MTEFEHRLSLITVESMAKNAHLEFKCKNCSREPLYPKCFEYHCIEEYTKFLNSEHKEV